MLLTDHPADHAANSSRRIVVDAKTLRQAQIGPDFFGHRRDALIVNRGAREAIPEFKGEFALDVFPTKHNSTIGAWQRCSILVPNIVRKLPNWLDTGAEPLPLPQEYIYVLSSRRTLRLLLITRTQRLAAHGSRQVLSLILNPPAALLYAEISQRPVA